MKLIRLAAALAMVAAMGAAQASLIDHGTYTFDTTSGLQWLDVTLTRDLSYSNVTAGAGGWLSSGWRYATTSEVSNLLTSYVNPHQGMTQTGHYAEGSLFLDYFGITASFPQSEHNRLYALYNDGNNNYSAGRADVFVTSPNQSSVNSAWEMSNDWEAYFVGRSSMGSFLVQASPSISPVPAPPAFILMLTGLSVLGAAVRRKRVVEAA